MKLFLTVHQHRRQPPRSPQNLIFTSFHGGSSSWKEGLCQRRSRSWNFHDERLCESGQQW